MKQKTVGILTGLGLRGTPVRVTVSIHAIIRYRERVGDTTTRRDISERIFRDMTDADRRFHTGADDIFICGDRWYVCGWSHGDIVVKTMFVRTMTSGQ